MTETGTANSPDYRSEKQKLPAVFRDLLGEQMTKDINRALAAQSPAAERTRLEHAVAVAAVNQRKTRKALDAAVTLVGRVSLMPYMTANDKASEVFHAAVTRLMELDEKEEEEEHDGAD